MSVFDLELTDGISESSTNPIAKQILEACKKIGKEVDEALITLGKRYFEDHCDDVEAEYVKEISELKKLRDKEYLYNQYRLSIDGKRLCEHCNAIVTADSLFCNKCGKSLTALDFSQLDISIPEQETTPVVRDCPNCGAKIEDGALFCETCGTKLQ